MAQVLKYFIAGVLFWCAIWYLGPTLLAWCLLAFVGLMVLEAL